MNSLVIYCTRGGKTGTLAEKIGSAFHCKPLAVTPDTPYGSFPRALVRVIKERIRHTVPPYNAPQADLSAVDTVFVGYPVHCGRAPAYLLDYLGKCDLNGKTVIPFSTSMFGGMKPSLESLKAAAVGANVVHPYCEGKFTENNFDAWVSSVREG